MIGSMHKKHKHIVIIGGGISGLSVLHYLHQQNNNEKYTIELIEKNSKAGGTIQTQNHAGSLFETGPNGFLFPENETFDLANDLGLESELCLAQEEAAKRFILIRNKLHAVPASPQQALFFSGISFKDKLRIFLDLLIAKGFDPEESVYDFCKRRLGTNIAEYIADPVISGIYGGDVRRLSIRSAFPSVYKLEQQYGSLLRAVMLQKKKTQPKNRRKLTSFNKGMGQLMHHLEVKYADACALNESVQTIFKDHDQYRVITNKRQVMADIVVCSTPAYATASMIKNLSPELYKVLSDIVYAPIAVVGLGYKKKYCQNIPTGFGYLVPSIENKKVLGVLFESQIFNNRSATDEMLMRVMIGGRKGEALVSQNSSALQSIAIEEIQERFGIRSKPCREFFIRWQRAIPQYEKGYNDVAKKIKTLIEAMPHFYISANYLNGIAFNDCIRQGEKTANTISDTL